MITRNNLVDRMTYRSSGLSMRGEVIARTVMVLLVMTLAAMAAGCAVVDGDAVATGATAGGEAPVATFDMKSMGGRPLIDVVLNGEGPYTFFLDTGASHSVLDAGLARQLALPVTGHIETGSPMGDHMTDAEVVTIPTLAVGDLVFEQQPMATMDLASMMPGGGMPLGVISYRLFEGYRLEFDYPGQTLRLYAGPLPEPDGKTVFAFETEIPSIRVMLAGQTYDMHLDTGSPSSFMLPLALAAELPLQSELAVVGRGRTVDAEFEVLGADLDGDAVIGQITIEQPQIRFVKEAPVGNVGSAVLGRFVVTVDPSNNRVQLIEAVPVSQIAGFQRMLVGGGGKKRYGIRFRDLEGDPIAVAGVDPGAPAALAGLLAGDMILLINGQAVEDLDRDARIRGLRASPLELTIQRGEETRKLVMSLE